MSMWKMPTDYLLGDGLWRSPQLIATIGLGPDAFTGGQSFTLTPFIVGLTLHLLTSAMMGIAYVPLLRIPLLRARPVITAVVYAFIAWLDAQYILIPLLWETGAEHGFPVRLAVAHLVFGPGAGHIYSVVVMGNRLNTEQGK